MRIFVGDLLQTPEASLGFDERFHYEGEAFDLIEAKGRIQNKSGVTTLTGNVRVPLARSCDRCLCAFCEQFSLTFERTIVHRVYDPVNEDEYIVPQEGFIDLCAICREEVYLALSPVTLCSPDCKGLCPVCGQNLNERDCGCDMREPDPRLAKLYELLGR